MSTMTFSYIAERAAGYKPVQRKSQFRRPVSSGSSSLVSRAVSNPSVPGVWLEIEG